MAPTNERQTGATPASPGGKEGFASTPLPGNRSTSTPRGSSSIGEGGGSSAVTGSIVAAVLFAMCVAGFAVHWKSKQGKSQDDGAQPREDNAPTVCQLVHHVLRCAHILTLPTAAFGGYRSLSELCLPVTRNRRLLRVLRKDVASSKLA